MTTPSAQGGLSRLAEAGFDIGQRIAVTLVAAGDEAARAVGAQMDPYVLLPAVDRAAGVVIEFAQQDVDAATELLNPARDGLTTGAFGPSHGVVAGGRVCLVSPSRGQAHLRLDPGFPLSRIVRLALRPAMQLALLEAGAVAIHAACVHLDGQAIAVAGWSESGKTETALALAEGGAEFVSDKWTILGDDARAATFPITVGVRRWALDALPRLRGGLSFAARARLGVAGAVAAVTKPVRRPMRGRQVGRLLADGLDRGLAAADRVALSPTQVAAAYGHELDPAGAYPLGTLAMLSTVPGSAIDVEAVGPEWVARRLARSAAYERRGYFDLLDRARFAGDDAGETSLRLEAEQREEALLARALAGVRLLRVRAPFPADPRALAAAILDRDAR